ncbi:hypothetical protein RYX56_24575, partial [Alkalihalophilus lindianensis]|nr:hypothetical protein [Alkalihalophilus lindianensis]
MKKENSEHEIVSQANTTQYHAWKGSIGMDHDLQKRATDNQEGGEPQKEENPSSALIDKIQQLG